LKSIIESYREKEEKLSKEYSKSLNNKIDASTNTENSKMENLWYMKGFFNGTIELVSYLIEYMINKTNNSTVFNCNNNNNYSYNDFNQKSLTDTDIFNTELFINGFRKFHRIYFKENKLDHVDTSFIVKPYKKKKFPSNNKKLIKKVFYALGNNTLRPKFYKSVLKICKKGYQNSRSDSSNSSINSSGESSNEESVYSSKSNSNICEQKIRHDLSSDFLKEPVELTLNNFYSNTQHNQLLSNEFSKDKIANKESKKDINCNLNDKTQIICNEYSNLPTVLNNFYCDDFQNNSVNDFGDNTKPKKIKSNSIQRHSEETDKPKFRDLIDRKQSFFIKRQIQHDKIQSISEIHKPFDQHSFFTENQVISFPKHHEVTNFILSVFNFVKFHY
jgi:hypothetical protein